jgi:hypothetical protein
VVGSELNLIALLGGAVGYRHDTRIVEQNIQSLLLLLESIGSGLDRGKVGEIQRQKLDFCVRDLSLDVVDCGSGF